MQILRQKVRARCLTLYILKEQFREVYERRKRKMMILREYWNGISDKCSKLSKNKHASAVRKFNGDQFFKILDKVRD